MNRLKIFISADMEGITGVIHWDETGNANPDYQYFRKIMTQEVNAAIQGIRSVAEADIIVRDAHGSALNIIPDLLDKNALLLRNWSQQPLSMMEGIDPSFDAVACVGYHAKAMTSDGTLAHTMNGNILDLRVNGISVPELGWNALIAGDFDVPVIFVSGDEAICEQAQELIPRIETVSVKKGIGEGCLSLHPDIAKQKINEGMKRAIHQRSKIAPLEFEPPYKVEIDFKKKKKTTNAAWYPGAERKGNYTIVFESNHFFDCMRFFHFVH